MPNYSHSTRLTLASAEEPPYLAVGTDVSAKYKGAFCEAKIIDVNKHVKLRVLFDGSSGSYLIDDTDLKSGTLLETGTKIEAKHPEKKQQTYVLATITKILDHSRYTVVFDDGDQCVLRRNSLCLKSGKHFAESETLDQLPLTNPEHFGNPVKVGAIEQQQHCHNNNQNNNHNSSSQSNSNNSNSTTSTTTNISSNNKDPQSSSSSHNQAANESKPKGRAAAAVATPTSGRRGGPKGRKRRESVNNGLKQIPLLDEDSADSNPEQANADSNDSNVKFDLIEVGVKLMVQYGKGKIQNVYEAKVNKIETNSAGKTQYFVHYTGWNNRYDEWITKNRILSIVTDKEYGSKDGRLRQPVDSGSSGSATTKESKERNAPPAKTRRTAKSTRTNIKESSSSKAQADVNLSTTNSSDDDTKKSVSSAKVNSNASNAGSTDDSSQDNDHSSSSAASPSKGLKKSSKNDEVNNAIIPDKTQTMSQTRTIKESSSNYNDTTPDSAQARLAPNAAAAPASKNTDATKAITTPAPGTVNCSSNATSISSATSDHPTKQTASATRLGSRSSNLTYSPSATTKEAKERSAPPAKTRRTAKSTRTNIRESSSSKAQADVNISTTNSSDDDTKKSVSSAKVNSNAPNAGSTDDSSQDNDQSSSSAASPSKGLKKPSLNDEVNNAIIPDKTQTMSQTRTTKESSSNYNDTTPDPAQARLAPNAAASPASKNTDPTKAITTPAPGTVNCSSNATSISSATSDHPTKQTASATRLGSRSSNLTYSPPASTTSFTSSSSSTTIAGPIASTASPAASATEASEKEGVANNNIDHTKGTTKEERMVIEPLEDTAEGVANHSLVSPASKTVYSFCDEIDESDCDKKISIIQERIMALRQTYMSLKSELNDLDRRRKRPRTERSNSEHINCGLLCRN